MKRLTLALLVFAVALHEGVAVAHQGYPSVVQTALGLSKTPGCQLCHLSSAGMGPLNAFGSLLVQKFGLDPSTANEDDASLKGALVGLAAEDPQFIADIKEGKEPSEDPAIHAQSLPQAQYGCAIARSHGGWALAWLALGIVLAARRLRGR